MADRPTPAEVRAEGRRLLAEARRSTPGRYALADHLMKHADVLLADPGEDGTDG